MLSRRTWALGLALAAASSLVGCQGLAVGFGATVGGEIGEAASRSVAHSYNSREPNHAAPQPALETVAVERPPEPPEGSLVRVLPAVAPSGRGMVAAISHDGISLATAHSGANDGVQVRLWDLHSRQPVCAVKEESADVVALAFSRDDSLLAVARDSGAIELVETTTGEVLTTRHGHTRGPLALAFSPEGKTLASSGSDGSVLLWSLGDRSEPATLVDFGPPTTALAYSGDGRVIAVGAVDGKVRLVDVATAKSAPFPSNWVSRVLGVDFLSDGERVAAVGTSGLALYDAKSGEMRDGVSAGARCFAASPDAHLFAIGLQSGRVMLWEPGTGAGGFRAFYDLGSELCAVGFTPDGREVVAACFDGSVFILDPEQRRDPAFKYR